MGATPDSRGEPTTTLYGRGQECALIERSIASSRSRGSALLLRGEAGVGKSALLAFASARARAQGMSVLDTAGVQTEARLAFAGLHQMLQHHLHAIDRLPRPQQKALRAALGLAPSAAGDRFLIALATLGIIAEIASTQPLLILVDDVHWMDAPTAEVLAFVSRRIEAEPVVMLFVVREGLTSSVNRADLRGLQLRPLDDRAAAELLESSAGSLRPESRDRLMREAAGNPLALVELHKALRAAGGRTAILEPLPLTDRLERTFAARMPADDRTRTLLLLASLDDTADLGELLRAASMLLGADIDAGALGPASSAGLGAVEHGAFRFRHPLVRSAIQRAASPAERRRAHAALAEILAPDSERRVWHRAAAAQPPDEAAAKDLEDAADRADLRGAGGIAVDALALAADLSVDVHRAGRLLRAAERAFELGRWEQSRELVRQTQKLRLSLEDRTRVSYMVEVLDGSWSGASSIRGFAQIAEDLGREGDTVRALAALNAVGVRSHWANLDVDTRRRVVEVAEGLGVPRENPAFLSVLALADPVTHGREVIGRLSRLTPAAAGDPNTLFAAGGAANAVWAEDIASPLLAGAIEGFRVTGRLAPLAQALVFDAWAQLHIGNFRAARSSAAEAASLAEETRQVRYVVAAHLALSVAEAARESDENAEQLIDASEATLIQMGANPMLALVALARGRAALSRERFSEAYAQLTRIFDPADVAFQPFVRGWALADLAEAIAQGGGDSSVATDFMAEWEAIAQATGARHLGAQLRLVRALLAPPARCEPLFAAAVAENGAWPAYRARAQLALGAWLRRQRRIAESRVPLRDAERTFEALGLSRLAARTRRELRASGETARRRTPDARDQLTPQELQIAQLAARGLTNREIAEQLYLSPRTVGSHLYRLFPKLGVTSRTELTRALEPVADPADGGLEVASTALHARGDGES